MKKLSPYKEVLDEALSKLKITTPIELFSGEGWYFDLDSSRKKFKLTCPGFSASNKCIFLHYLCHAKILEEGWPMPIVQLGEVKGHDLSKNEDLFFGFVNRSLDHFFDYFAWLLVIEKFGNQYFLQISKSISATKPSEFVNFFEKLFEQTNLKYSSYLMILDWFVLFHTLSILSGNKEREKKLGALFQSLAEGEKLSRFTVSDFEERVKILRKFFRNMLNKYPDYRSLIKAKKVEQYYRDYYSIVWLDTGLISTIKKFY